MSITLEEVKKLASLSRIKLSEEELLSMQKDIDSILGYVEQINKVSGDIKVEIGRRNIWREDNEENDTGSYTEKLLSNAPTGGREKDYLKVKKILG